MQKDDDDDAKSKITDKLTRLSANISKNLISAQDNNVHRSFLVNEKDFLSICQLGKVENEADTRLDRNSNVKDTTGQQTDRPTDMAEVA